jgi:hypothetical protein
MPDQFENRETPQNLFDLRDQSPPRVPRAKKFDLIFRIYAVMGIFIAIAAFSYFIFTLIDINLSEAQSMALLLAATGLSLSVLSAIFLFILRQSSTLKEETYRIFLLKHHLLKEWEKFENNSRTLLQEKDAKFNANSPRLILKALEQNELVSTENTNDINFILEIRNKIAHDANDIPVTAIEAALRILNQINSRLNVDEKASK